MLSNITFGLLLEKERSGRLEATRATATMKGKGHQCPHTSEGGVWKHFLYFSLKCTVLVHFESYLNVTITRKWSVLTPREPEIR